MRRESFVQSREEGMKSKVSFFHPPTYCKTTEKKESDSSQSMRSHGEKFQQSKFISDIRKTLLSKRLVKP